LFTVFVTFISAAIQIAQASRIAPDSPNIENIDRDAVAGIVEGLIHE